MKLTIMVTNKGLKMFPRYIKWLMYYLYALFVFTTIKY